MNNLTIERVASITAVLALLLSLLLFSSNRPNYILPLWVVLGNLSLAVFIAFKDIKNAVNRSFLLMVSSISVWSISAFIAFNTEKAPMLVFWAIYLGTVFIPSTFLSFSFVFPKKVEGWSTWKEMSLYAVSAAFVLMIPAGLLIKDIVFYPGGFRGVYGSMYPFMAAFIVLCLVGGYVRIYLSYLSSRGRERSVLKVLLLGLALTLLLGLATNLLMPMMGISRYNSVGPLFSYAMITFIAYTILNKKLYDVYQVFRSGMVYTITALAIAVTYSLIIIISGGGTAFLIQAENYPVIVLAAFVVSAAFGPFFEMLQKYAFRLFSKVYRFQERVQEISRKIAFTIKLDEITSLVVSSIGEILDTSEVSVLLYDRFKRKYKSFSKERIGYKSHKYSEMELSADAPLVAALNSKRTVIVREELSALLDNERNETELRAAVDKTMADLQMDLFVPVFLRDELVGMIALGKKNTLESYSPEEISLLQMLSTYIAVAYDNAKLYEEILNMKTYNDLIFESLPSAIVTMDLSGMMTSMNSVAEALFETMRGKAVGRSCLDLFVRDKELCAAVDSGLLGKETRDREIIVKSIQGDVPVSLNTRMLKDINGNRVGLLLVVTDLSEIKKLEEHLRRSDKLAALGTMAAGMAHEIKNPLSSLKVFTQMMPMKFDNAEYRKKYSEIMPREINRIDRIVEGLLSYARTSRPNYELVSLNEIIEEAAGFFKQSAEEKKVDIRTSLVDVHDIIGDRQQLSQVFVNIILNAVQSIETGGSVDISSKKIGKKIKGEERECVCVEIKDTGVGIGEEDMPKLFDPFFTTKYGGTGLGLTIAHGIIDGHGGLIEAESSLSKGSVFRVCIPVGQRKVS